MVSVLRNESLSPIFNLAEEIIVRERELKYVTKRKKKCRTTVENDI